MQHAKTIDGRALAAAVKRSLAERIDRLKQAGRTARLDVILVGGNSSAKIYARNQGATCRELGIDYKLHDLPENASEDQIIDLVAQLNEDEQVTAIMVHLPLPLGVDTERVQSLIAPHKDVEGVNPANIGNIVYGQRSLIPCTALAVIEMIESTGIELRGSRCVCVGASNIVGKPIVVLLMRAEATVISTNKFTPQMGELTRTADVLVSAAGVAGLIQADMVKAGAVVVDVGISRVRTEAGLRTVGDVDYDAAAEIAGHISPVPGGVGPMTVAMLLRNTIEAAEFTLGSQRNAGKP